MGLLYFKDVDIEQGYIFWSKQIMNNLISLHNSKPMTDSLAVAKVSIRQHKTVLARLDKLIENGTITEQEFLLSEYLDNSGKRNRMYLLTEDAFLIALPFIGGKKAEQGQRQLVKAFSRFRNQSERRAKLEWQENRSKGIEHRKRETDAIQELINYATQQGSRNAVQYYNLITKATYKAIFDFDMPLQGVRELLDEGQLLDLAAAESVAAKVIRQGIAAEKPYKAIFKDVKGALELYAQILGKTSVISEVAA